MDIITVFNTFPDQQACIQHLENLRWGEQPQCPYCHSMNVARKAEGERVGRWNCHDCTSSFNVLAGTIFQGTKVELQKWFLAISIYLNAKKSVSSYQLARDLDLTQKTAWYMGMRIRQAMVEEDTLLQGIIEADETYVGGKPRKGRKKDDDDKRGRGTKKTPVIGALARGGKVVAKPSERVTGKTVKAFLGAHIDASNSVLVTDEFSVYRRMSEWIEHLTIEHAVRYVEGIIHTNTLEGFWSLVKRAIFGHHHHYSKDFAAAYIVEACYKYNTRNSANQFDDFLTGAVQIKTAISS